MATLVALDGVAPTIGRDVYLAPTAVLIGDVRIGDRANIWFGAVLRGDFTHIEVGDDCSIQDNAVVHCAEELPTILERRVLVGHNAMLEGCVIEEGALIGMGAIVLQRARVKRGAMLAAGAVVSERVEIPSNVLAAGVPARVKKELDGSAKRWTETAIDEYQALRARYLKSSALIPTP